MTKGHCRLLLSAAACIVCCAASAAAAAASQDFSFIDTFDVGCDVEGTYECMMYGLISIDGEIVRAQNRPTVTVTESDAHSFLYTIEYPNAGPEKSSFRTLGGEDARPLVIEAFGPVNVEPAICAWALPATRARFGEGSAQVRTAHCYDTADESGSMLNFVGEDCATIVMNAGEPDVPNTGEDYDHPFSVTYECHRVPPAPEPETEG